MRESKAFDLLIDLHSSPHLWPRAAGSARKHCGHRRRHRGVWILPRRFRSDSEQSCSSSTLEGAAWFSLVSNTKPVFRDKSLKCAAPHTFTNPPASQMSSVVHQIGDTQSLSGQSIAQCTRSRWWEADLSSGERKDFQSNWQPDGVHLNFDVMSSSAVCQKVTKGRLQIWEPRIVIWK